LAEVVRKPLTRQVVLDTAVRIADERGLKGLSMRKLAKELGVKPTALYNHVSSKDALLDGMIETVMSKMGSPPAHTGSWEDRIRERLLRSREIAHQHPNVYRLFATRFTTHIPQVLELVEDLLGTLREAGLDPLSALHAYRALVNYTIGYALAEIRGFSLESEDPDLPPPFRSQRPIPEDFPRVIELAPHLKHVDHDQEFAFGLNCIIAGLKAELEM
jgi:AcrR family transcriptional regulator